MERVRTKRPNRAVHRLLDVSLATILIVVLAPVFVALALAIRLQDGRPALFRQRRYGRDGRTFLCYKFRSMAPDAQRRLDQLLKYDADARQEWARDHKLRRDPRVTPLGRIIRKLSLDELPQLINVLRGEMSLVGPRPIIAAEVPRYGTRFVNYCAVRPGITGIWQISGRNDVGYKRRVAMDSYLARNLSPKLYARILAGTVSTVMLGRGAY